jgi:D-aminoacyl-tRNA deacylase
MTPEVKVFCQQTKDISVMRAVAQRVTEARVTVDDQVVGRIAHGLLVLLGVEQGDEQKDLLYMADKLAGLRVFEDEAGLMNRSVVDVGGSLLIVSQFTLLGDVRRGRRPSFTAAAPPVEANEKYRQLCQRLREQGIAVEQGVFQADMQVSLVNDGPVTILLDSRKLF